MRSTTARGLAASLLLIACLAAAGCALATSSPGHDPAAPAGAGDVEVLIQGAVDTEVLPLVDALAGVERVQIDAWTFWRGTLGGRRVVVSRTEVGPINAVAATTVAIRTFRPRLVINQGTAGALTSDLRVFDLVVGESTVDYGATRAAHADRGEGSDPSAWTVMPHRFRFDGEERTAVSAFPGEPSVLALALAHPYGDGRVVKGAIGSAYQFNQEVDRLEWIHGKFGALSEDMESAYAAGASLALNTPFLAIRIISDSDFYAPGIHPEAAARCARFVASLVSVLPKPLRLPPPRVPRAAARVVRGSAAVAENTSATAGRANAAAASRASVRKSCGSDTRAWAL